MGKNKYHTTWHNNNITNARKQNMKTYQNKQNTFRIKHQTNRKVAYNMQMKKMDLFSVPEDYALCHCISSDIAMGAGIAIRFKDMGVKTAIIELCGVTSCDTHGHTNKWTGNGYCIPVTVSNRKVYNLVTKERYWEKPTLDTLRSALQHMKSHTAFDHTAKIAMPMIGCGLDKLKWDDVKAIIEQTFSDTNIEILICYL